MVHSGRSIMVYPKGNPPDFFNPSGITRVTIVADKARIEYVLTGITLHSNIPAGSYSGQILKAIILSNPPPNLAFRPEHLSFRCFENDPCPEEKLLFIKNEGSGRLGFRFRTRVPWLRIDPVEGERWGKEKAIKVRPNPFLIEEGKYESLIEIGNSPPSQGYGQIKVELIVESSPLYPPLNLTAKKRIKKMREPKDVSIVLSWQANPLNRKIEGYRIYLYSFDQSWVCLRETPKNNFYLKIKEDLPLKFGVCVFDRKNRESEKALVYVR